MKKKQQFLEGVDSWIDDLHASYKDNIPIEAMGRYQLTFENDISRTLENKWLNDKVSIQLHLMQTLPELN